MPVLDREGKLLAVAVAINKHDTPAPSAPDATTAATHAKSTQSSAVSRRTTRAPASPSSASAAAALYEGRSFEAHADLPSLCVMAAKAGEAMDNLYRRAEEHNSFAQNMDALQVRHRSPPS